MPAGAQRAVPGRGAARRSPRRLARRGRPLPAPGADAGGAGRAVGGVAGALCSGGFCAVRPFGPAATVLLFLCFAFSMVPKDELLAFWLRSWVRNCGPEP